VAKTYGELGPNGATYGDLFSGAPGSTYGTEPANGGGGGNGGGGPDSGGGARARRRRRYVSTLGILRRR
jgi:hypothetical protein